MKWSAERTECERLGQTYRKKRDIVKEIRKKGSKRERCTALLP